MAVSVKLKNADLPPLSFPNFSKSGFSVSVSLPYASEWNSLSDNISLSSKHLPNSPKELLSMVSGVLFLTKCTFHLNLLCLIFFYCFNKI